MNGILLIDKPAGMTSHDVINRLRRITGIKKIGHTGTLDPNAQGLLVVLLGEATKLIPYLQKDDKEYEAEIIFGYETDTDDITGKPVSRKESSHITSAGLENALSDFSGEIIQYPPAYSARKKNGRKLYEYARAGESVEVEPRRLNISKIDLLQTDELPDRAVINVCCSKGTYIRALIRDLGRALDGAACMGALKRIRSDGYSLDQAIELDNITSLDEIKAGFIPIDSIVLPLAEIKVSDQGKTYLLNGNLLFGRNIQNNYQDLSVGEKVQLTLEGKLAGIGQIVLKDGIKKIQPKRILNTVPL